MSQVLLFGVCKACALLPQRWALAIWVPSAALLSSGRCCSTTNRLVCVCVTGLPHSGVSVVDIPKCACSMLQSCQSLQESHPAMLPCYVVHTGGGRPCTGGGFPGWLRYVYGHLHCMLHGSAPAHACCKGSSHQVVHQCHIATFRRRMVLLLDAVCSSCHIPAAGVTASAVTTAVLSHRFRPSTALHAIQQYLPAHTDVYLLQS
jgi:hypothetical protein